MFLQVSTLCTYEDIKLVEPLNFLGNRKTMNFGHPNSETCQMLAELLSPQVIKLLRAMCAFPKQHRSGRVRDFIPWLGKTKKRRRVFQPR